MLTTSNSYSTEFFKEKRLFLDSTVLIDWAASPSLDAAFEEVQREYSLILCTVSLLEVGFGPPGKPNSRELERARGLYDLALRNVVDSIALHRYTLQNIRTPAICAYNPTAHEWYASRTHLMALIREQQLSVKTARTLMTDALIYTCAWNARAAIVTENTRDFMKFNSVQQKHPSGNPRHLPIFTMENTFAALKKDVSYPETLESAPENP